MDAALKKLGNVPNTHGLPRNPQWQGLVERANGTVKRKVLMRCMDAGYKEAGSTFDWVPHFEGVISNENVAPLKVYRGLTAFLCLRHRPRLAGDHEPLSVEDVGKMYEYMAQRQQDRAVRVVNQSFSKYSVFSRVIIPGMIEVHFRNFPC